MSCNVATMLQGEVWLVGFTLARFRCRMASSVLGRFPMVAKGGVDVHVGMVRDDT